MSSMCIFSMYLHLLLYEPTVIFQDLGGIKKLFYS